MKKYLVLGLLAGAVSTQLRCIAGTEEDQLLVTAVFLRDIAKAAEALDKGANVNHATQTNNYTPLHKAAETGRLNLVKLLIDRGAHVNAQAIYGLTPLHKAALHGHLNVVKFLVDNGADVNARSEYDDTPLHKAALHGHLNVVKFLVDNGANINARSSYDNTSLHNAARRGHLNVVKFLVSKGAHINAQDDEGITPLHDAFQQRRLDVAKFLVSRCANINAQDKEDRRTPLHVATSNYDLNIVKFLVKNGADMNIKDRHQNSAMQLAMLLHCPTTVKELILRGASPSMQNPGVRRDFENWLRFHDIDLDMDALFTQRQHNLREALDAPHLHLPNTLRDLIIDIC